MSSTNKDRLTQKSEEVDELLDLSSIHEQAGTRLTRKPEEVGELLGIGRNGIYALIRQGEIRSIKVGRKILIPLSAITDFLRGE
jgi:excisionase family DNA binding protein